MEVEVEVEKYEEANKALREDEMAPTPPTPNAPYASPQQKPLGNEKEIPLTTNDEEIFQWMSQQLAL